MVFVHSPDEVSQKSAFKLGECQQVLESVLEINLADKTRDEVEATGKFFSDITGVFKVSTNSETLNRH